MRPLRTVGCWLLCALVFGVSGRADETPSRGFDSTWVHALEQMVRPQTDSVGYRLTSLVLQQPDFVLTVDSGLFFPFTKVHTPTDSLVYGGFLTGRMTFDFRPPVRLEQDQLQRFFKADTLVLPAWEAVVLFDASTWELIRANGVQTAGQLSGKQKKLLDDFQKPLTRKEDFWFLFTALRAAVHPRPEPYLLVNCAFEERDQVVYLCDPYHREQVHLFREHDVPGEEFMELVSQYATSIDSSYAGINGVSTDQIEPLHYDIKAVLWNDGKLRAQTAARFEVLDSSAQFIRMVLHRELKVDSIVGANSTPVPFLRYRDDDHKQQSLYLFLSEPLEIDDTLTLTFFYTGDIAKRKVGEFHVEAGASWYPRYGYASRSTYDVQFKTPRDLTFIVSAERTDSVVIGDTLVTDWSVKEPAANIGFNIGHFTRYEYGGGDLPLIELFYNEPLHRSILKGSGQRVYKDVGADIEQSLRLFDSLFGPYAYPNLAVGEIVFEHGESFPGFLHLGANTFTGTDHWGADQLFRAHEVAHQWFGSTVGYATYHDQWLSEGIAEYAALLYLQKEKGDKAFHDKLKEYRKSVFSARRYLFFSGAESGPIIQGYRTASSKTRGDYNLIIYRKAALVLHMVRGLLTDLMTGDDARFFEMMREYVRTFSGRPATTGEFRELVEEFTGTDQSRFFGQWVYGNELPEVESKTDISRSSDGRWEIVCRLKRRNVTDPFVVDLPIEIEFEVGPPERRRVALAQPDTVLRLSYERKPKKVRLNPFEFALISVK